MSFLLAFIFALSSLSMPAMNASLEAPATTHEALLDRPITAPSQAHLEAPEVEVTTTPAPASQAPTQAPAPQVSPIPKGAPIDQSEAPSQTAPHAPEGTAIDPTPNCEEDMPCWEGSINDDRYNTPAEDTVEDAPQVGTATPEDNAWASVQALGPDVEVLEGYALKYFGTFTEEPTDLPATQFAVMDTETFDCWHVFGYVVQTDA